LSRLGSKIGATGEAPLELSEVLSALGAPGGDEGAAARREAIACYLSGGDGWRDAGRRLGGAFSGKPSPESDKKP
jgi:hypothetical protein